MQRDESVMHLAPPERAYELGYKYEAQYGACSQCTLLAVMDALDARDESVFRSAFGFAGGIGSLSETCGALAAGVIAISMLHGRELDHLETDTEADKKDCMRMVRALHNKYLQEYGTIRCADIHLQIFGRTFDQWEEADFAEFLRLGGHVDKCTEIVGKAAKWTVEILTETGSASYTS